MLLETELASDERVENKKRRISGRTSAKLWVTAAVAGIVFSGAWLKSSASGERRFRRCSAAPRFHKSW